jgi:hypothetical protein
MKRSMARVLWVAIGTLVLAAAGMAAPMCTGTVTIQSLEAAGCQLGVVVFDNFSFVNPSSGGTPYVPSDTNVNITIDYNSPLNVVTFTPVNAADWDLTSNFQQFAFTVTYTVTAPTAFFLDWAPSISGLRSGTGGFSIVETINGSAVNGADAFSSNPPPTLFAGGPVSTFNVSDNIQASSGSSGTSSLFSVTNSFTVPEPLSSVLLGSGLLALGFLLRCKRR